MSLWSLQEAKKYTDKEVKTVMDSIDAHLAESASTSQKGHVQLSTSTTSTSTSLAATASAVKTVNDALTSHKAAAAPHSGHETPAGAQAKAEAAAGAVQAELAAHKAESAIHKTSDVIRTETNTQLKVEVISSSVSETPDAGRIIFDTSQDKFFGGNGTGWV